LTRVNTNHIISVKGSTLEIHVVPKGEEWWVMIKSPASPEMNPVGQRLVKMQWPQILKVVHQSQEEALKEAAWLREHLLKWESKKGKRRRQRIS
jgi:hypothetical protein